jgi:hypothetical protein
MPHFKPIQRNLHLALGPRGDVDALAARLNEDMPRALRQDMQNHLNRLQRGGRQLDALMVLHLTLPEDDRTRARWTRLAETQAVRQIDRHRLLHRATSDRESIGGATLRAGPPQPENRLKTPPRCHHRAPNGPAAGRITHL